jgi:hypothetical protein
MADTPTFQPNPYANFDPSQWSNPYSQFYGKALPWPSSYAGMPNNALGQPIQQPPGMTLNSAPPPAPASSPASGAQFPTGSPLWQAQQSGASPAKMQAMFSQMSPTLNGQANPNYAPSLMAMMGAGAGGAAPQAPAGGAGAANNWQQTLGMLANPGQVTTPGATVPQAPSAAQPDPGVLQSFLANWKPQQSGPGSRFTQNFNTILRGLQGQKGS